MKCRAAFLLFMTLVAGSAAAASSGAPFWLEDPIDFTGMINCGFDQHLHDYIRDDGREVTFAKGSGPDWLSVTSDGQLLGNPQGVPDTLQTFTLKATSDGQTSTATLEIWVENRVPPCDPSQSVKSKG